MTADDRGPVAPAVYHQEIRVDSGIGYGVIGADLHVFGDGVPLYLLENWHNGPDPDPAWLRELPSRLLNARFEVVDFTGRGGELRQLREWRQAGPRLAVRWLHGAGGAGKTRLAAKFATESAAENWKVVTATQGPGVLLPVLGSQDLRPGDAAGLLLIVDYADRWPLTHLVMLLSNRLFRQSDVRTRILLVARTADGWPGIRAKLVSEQPATSSQVLEPLPGHSAQRERMFAAALDGFARYYGPADLSGLRPPAPLDHPDFALTLAIHMAALVTVDAHSAGRRAPPDMAGLTVYLLDREHDHWQQLFGDGTHELNPGERTFVTPPPAMQKVVFAAALTGPVSAQAGAAAVDSLALNLDSARVLTDHAVCYPAPAQPPAAVLEPLYPDRLAEDFLALTVPGHPADYPAQSWAGPAANTLLARSGDERIPAAWTPRAVTFLAAAAQRWPHVGAGYLYPLLQQDPLLALDAGGAALSSLASLDDAPASLFQAIEPHLPRHRHADLDAGIAAVTRRLTVQRLAQASDPQERAMLYSRLAQRQQNAGLRAEALNSGWAAAKICWSLAQSDPAAGELPLAAALDQLGTFFTEMGQRNEALDAARESVTIWKRLAADDPEAFERGLAGALENLGIALATAGDEQRALDAAEEALEIWRRLAETDPATCERPLAGSLLNVGSQLAKAERWRDAAARTADALDIYRRLADADPAQFEPDVALVLANLSADVAALGEWERALTMAQEAVGLYRRLAKTNPAAFESELAGSLNRLHARLMDLGRTEQSLDAVHEAVTIWRRLACALPAAYDSRLALSLHNLTISQSRLGRATEALAVAEEATAVWRRLARGEPAAFEPRLAHALSGLAVQLADLGRPRESLGAAQESVTILRRLAGEDPRAHAANLAMALTNLGGYLSGQGQLGPGLAVAQEAADLYRTLAAAYPAAREPDLAVALNKLGVRHSQLRHPEQAASAFGEAAVIYRRLAAARPGMFEPELAQVLRNLSPELDQAGRHAEAAETEQEAVALLRLLAAADHGVWAARLAGALGDLSASRAMGGRPRDAVPLAREAIAILRPLAAADPGAYRADLARIRRVLALAQAKGAWPRT